MSTFWAVGGIPGNGYQVNRIFKNVDGAGWVRVYLQSPYEWNWKPTAVSVIRPDYVVVALGIEAEFDNPIILTTDGINWSDLCAIPKESSFIPQVNAILGFAEDDIFFIRRDAVNFGEGGVYTWNGSVVTKIADATTFGATKFQPCVMGGIANNDLWVGEPDVTSGFNLNHWNGSTWDRRDNIAATVHPSGKGITALATDRVYLAAEGAVWKWDGLTWSQDDIDVNVIFYGVFGELTGNVHSVGGDVIV